MLKVFLIALACLIAGNVLGEKPQPSLQISYFQGDHTNAADTATLPNVLLYVPADQAPTPFLPVGEFTAVWSGFVSAESRGDYSFQAELNGNLKLEINGQMVLESSEPTSALSKPVRLNRGTNAITVTFRSPKSGDALVRLQWKPKGSFLRPISSSAFSHLPTEDEQRGSLLRLGRELFVEHRCAKCHTATESGMPELAMDAPAFEGIGERRNPEWMAHWIEDPKSLRTSAHMPKLFASPSARSDSEAVASFLASLKAKTTTPASDEGDAKAASAGKKLFATLHCAACHLPPDSKQLVSDKISLKQVRVKFAPGKLTEFLKQPEAHYAWTRMPRFKLTDAQRAQLAAYLLSNSDSLSERPFSNDPAILQRGKKLLQTSGCLNCHSSGLKNEFSAKTVAEISNWETGCLAESPNDSKAPRFDFSPGHRAALLAFVRSDRKSLGRHVPQEFAERQTRSLNCTECHGKIENVPAFEILGGKLKPEWAARFLAGEIAVKPRPWVAAQMPAFAKRAQLLAQGMALQYGLPATTPPEKSMDAAAAEIGRQLVSAPPVGFSCVTCHAVGKAGASQVFESPGINLAQTGERLQPDFFRRWLLSPSMIDPITKMPTYFDEEGNSPLTEIYHGDGQKQIHAIWEYIRLGDKMPAPTLE